MMYYCLLCLGLTLATTAFPGGDKQVKEWSFYKPRGSPLHVKVTVEVTGDEEDSKESECTNDDDCPEDRQCYWKSCGDPCLSDTVCGPNTDCSVSNHAAFCSCKDGYYGDPRTGCDEVAVLSNYFEVTDGRFYVKDSRYINFTSARDECIRRGLHLATFRDESDYDQLKTLLRSNGRDRSYYKQYIGAIYNSELERFEWESTDQPLTYTSWADDEPTPVGPEGQREDCVVIEKARDYNMNNIDCSDNAGFICEDIVKQKTPQPDRGEITVPDEQPVDLYDIVQKASTQQTPMVDLDDYLDEITKIVNKSTPPPIDDLDDYLDKITKIVNKSTPPSIDDLDDYLDEITKIVNKPTPPPIDDLDDYLGEITKIVNKSTPPPIDDESTETDELDEITDDYYLHYLFNNYGR